MYILGPVLTSDASISEDSRDMSIRINFFLMLMLMFSEDIVDISIKCSLIGWYSYTCAYAYANMSSLDTSTVVTYM